MYRENNPLVLPILTILKNNNEPLGLFDLMQSLEVQGYELVNESDDLSYEVQMFRKNFAVMNALYQIKKDIIDTGYSLYISSLKILLCKSTEMRSLVSDDELDSHAVDQKMSNYYLDWANCESTDEQAINQLLNDFWSRYNDYQKTQDLHDRRLDSLKILELESTASWDDIQRSYRSKIAQSHPDRGGNSRRFIEIREAFQNLKFIFKKSL